jgi:hypothetical protein
MIMITGNCHRIQTHSTCVFLLVGVGGRHELCERVLEICDRSKGEQSNCYICHSPDLSENEIQL